MTLPSSPTGALLPGPRHAEWEGAPIRFVVSDLDGTYLGLDETPHPAVIRATHDAVAAGVRVGFATGRLPVGLPRLDIVDDRFGPHIVHNGAQVVGGPRPDTTDALTPLTEERVQALLEVALEHGLYAEFYAEDHFYISLDDERAHPSWEAISGPPRGLARERHPGTTIIKATIMDYAPDGTGAVLAAVRATGAEAEVSTSPIAPAARFINAMTPGVTKGSALKKVLDALDIDPAETAVIGDGANDVTMFELAGTCIAIDGAPEELRRRAHFVAPPEVGVARTIEALVLGREGIAEARSAAPVARG